MNRTGHLDPQDSTVYIERTEPHEHKRKPPPGIQGWGADRDPADRPAVPMERTPPRLENVHWDAPEEQRRSVTVLHSTERPGLTPIFSSRIPPAGLSGAIRRAGFQYSENDVRHWLMLLFADRVDMVEGLLDDLKRGHVPNVFAEMGGPAEWRHNRAGFMKKALVVSAVLAVVMAMRRRGRD